MAWVGTALRAFLKEWQPLIAASITASAAFITAFLVGRLNRRREENASAMALVTDLMGIQLMAENVTRIEVPAALLGQRVEALDTEVINRVCRQIARAPRVPLSPLFDGHVARVSPVDEILSSLLHRIRHEYLVIQQRLDRIEKVDLRRSIVNASFLRELGLTDDLSGVREGLACAREQAERAVWILERAFLSRAAFWVRVWRRLRRRSIRKAEAARSTLGDAGDKAPPRPPPPPPPHPSG